MTENKSSPQPVNILMIEDSIQDEALIIRVLKKAGYEVYHRRVASPETMREALKEDIWDIILSDFHLPAFNGLQAREIQVESQNTTPFIIVSGAIGEQTAVDMMRAGASDFIMKDNLSRLPAVIDREIREYKIKLKAASSLKESEAKFRTITNAMPQIVWSTLADGYHDYFNEQWYEYTGVEVGATDGDGWNAMFHPDDQQRAWKLWRHSLSTGERYEIEYRLRHRSGIYRWVLGRALPIRDDKKNIIRWMGTCTDIDDQKKREEEQKVLLKEVEFQRNRFSAIMKQMPGAVIVGEAPSGKIIFANDKMNEVWGFSLIESQTLDDVEWIGFHKDGRRYEPHEWPLTRSIQKGQAVTNEDVEVVRGDGKRAVLRLNSSPIMDDSGEIVAGVVICQDVTHLIEAIKARDEFLSIASHELKTPLTSLRLQFQLQKRLSDKNDPKAFAQERMAGLIDHGDKLIGKLNRLVEDMLDISRLSLGKLSIEKSQVDLGLIVEDVVNRMAPQYEHLGKDSLKFFKCEATGLFDSMRIEQVITNLLTNALKYGMGKPVEVRLTADGSWAKLEVTDNGYGISNDVRERIFDKFERAISPNEVSGLGLGLYIVKQIVLAHEGRIRVDSKEGEGSTFVIELPLLKEQ